MDSWKLRDELLKAMSQWYLILAFILAGGLIGYAYSYVAPAPYRAVQDIYLGIDVQRVNEMEYIIPLAEEEPLNLEDYKNWQLKQAADILTSDQVLNKTLNQLKANDAKWDDFTLMDFRKAADIYWFEAGTWRLEVTLPQQDQTVEAVKAWAENGHARVSELLEISRNGYDLDQEIWTINLAISDHKLQRAKLLSFKDSCQTWIVQFDSLDGNAVAESPLWDEFQNWISLYLSESSYWENLLADYPNEIQTNSQYGGWLTSKQALAAETLNEIEQQMDYLQAEKEKILLDYHEYLEDSLGLSANLILLPEPSQVEVEKVYQTGTATIGGAGIGLLAWILFALVRIRPQKDEHGK